MPTNISRKELIRKFRALGYSGPFSGSKHQFMIKGRKKIRIPNPHRGRDIHISLVKEILRQASIRSNEWDKV
jgi:predicted RNA binding protein YcfA (HicA-like mRNA interferase family)